MEFKISALKYFNTGNPIFTMIDTNFIDPTSIEIEIKIHINIKAIHINHLVQN